LLTQAVNVDAKAHIACKSDECGNPGCTGGSVKRVINECRCIMRGICGAWVKNTSMLTVSAVEKAWGASKYRCSSRTIM
jgi:hypothetical protein